MDKNIRISPSHHALVSDLSDRRRATIKEVTEELLETAAGVHIVVAISGSAHSVVEAYLNETDAVKRRDELCESGFSGADVSVSSRYVLSELFGLRPWGPAWKRAVGWTPGTEVDS